MDTDIPTVTLDTVYKALGEQSDIVLLDVRTPEEYGRGRIPGSINIPLNELPHLVPSSIPERSATIYAYCLTSHRSAEAVRMLMNLGYTSVSNMEFGLLGWRAKRFPTEP